eukprot:2002024-Pleurochrysis_carterae.AAC.1
MLLVGAVAQICCNQTPSLSCSAIQVVELNLATQRRSASNGNCGGLACSCLRLVTQVFDGMHGGANCKGGGRQSCIDSRQQSPFVSRDEGPACVKR